MFWPKIHTDETQVFTQDLGKVGWTFLSVTRSVPFTNFRCRTINLELAAALLGDVKWFKLNPFSDSLRFPTY
ncbi:MAG: hypothetical protein JWM11_7976 [Planctomycetaceae bacterium]|nr:hypothetical protein [Planctomycetaceae bacterium]